MKHIIILGDGMSDHPVERLGGLTPLEFASTPAMDRIAREGRNGSLVTIPDGFSAGSEVANTAILGYDLNKVYEGRGPLEAASIGYEMCPDDMAMRCNLLTLSSDGTIVNHHGGHLTTDEGRQLIETLDRELGSDKVKFIPGIQYRHLLVIKGGNKHIVAAPPHNHPGEPWRPLMVKPLDEPGAEGSEGRMSAVETAELINSLIEKSQAILEDHPVNRRHREQGRPSANSIWPWSQGYRPAMMTLHDMYPQVKNGAVITAVDLIRGIGRYAGLVPVDVEGATGMADTNYEGKCEAALEALRANDFVFLHVEATDEAGHDGDLDLKVKAIEYLDTRIIAPLLDEISKWDEPVAVALLPDHATPVEERVHRSEPVPFAIWHRGIKPDAVEKYSEKTCARGAYGTLRLMEFMHTFMKEQ